MAAAADARAELAAAAAEKKQIQERREAAERDRAAAEEQLQSARQEARENRRRPGGCQGRGGGRRQHHRRPQPADGGTEEEGRCRRGAAGPADMDTGALENRRRLLTEMEKEYEGFSKAVKFVCRAQSGLQGIHGPVANLVKTDGRYSLAIEIALGAGLQNIVVDREEDAKARHQLPEAAGRRTGHVPAPHRHPG